MSSSKQNPTFTKSTDHSFSKILRKRVNLYFKENNISRNANVTMVVKTIIMISLFFMPIILLCSGFITSTGALFTAYLICGLGMSGIGMGVMHDAIHGSYSKNKKINILLGYTINLIGANATVWKIQHNILHHTYTNINQADDDINTPFFLRFSPHAKHYRLHKFQYVYIWFFYAISTISWITTKDFVRLKRYKDMGFLNKKKEYEKALISLIVWKLLYYTYALIIPMIVIPLPWGLILLAFLSMHFVTGTLVSIVFQIAHIMPENEFPLPDENGEMKNEWLAHQFATTSNFAPKSKLIFWLVGGLNYQIEHHVLPDVCHVHYKKLSKIVVQTAKEFDMPYHSEKSIFQAISVHTKMLKSLGSIN